MRILIADDHDLFRDGMKVLLQQLGHVSIREAANRAEIDVQLQCKEQPDILFLDLDMPGVGSVQCVKEICAVAPKVAVIVISGNDAAHVIDACFNAGVLGFLPKSSSTDTMLAAIRDVYAGGMYIPTQRYKEQAQKTVLSARQKEIYSLLIEGKSNKQIAYFLGITESTVKQHVSGLFRKLGVTSRTQAIQKAIAISV